MTMNNPVGGGGSPVRDSLRTRPERLFENRRSVLIVLFVIPLLCIGFFVFKGCSDPMGGSDKVFAGKNSSVTVTAVPLVVAATLVPLGPQAGVYCSMLADVSYSAGVLPVSARVVVNGFTFADGGKVFIVDPAAGWISAGLVKCNGDLRLFERSYFIPATPTIIPSVTPTIVKQTATPHKIYVQGPTYTPYPTYTPAAPIVSAPGLGVYRESGDCWRFDISHIREIRVNRGDPVAGGSLVCGVKNFTVVVE